MEVKENMVIDGIELSPEPKKKKTRNRVSKKFNPLTYIKEKLLKLGYKPEVITISKDGLPSFETTIESSYINQKTKGNIIFVPSLNNNLSFITLRVSKKEEEEIQPVIVENCGNFTKEIVYETIFTECKIPTFKNDIDLLFTLFKF